MLCSLLSSPSLTSVSVLFRLQAPKGICWDLMTQKGMRSSLELFCVLELFFSQSWWLPVQSSFDIFNCIVHAQEHHGKCVRVTSSNREESIDVTLSALHIGGPSQPHERPQLCQNDSTDSNDDERNLVSFVDIMNAAEDAATQFEGDRRSLNWWPEPWFSDESSETEYSSAIELSNGTSSPQFEEDCESSGSTRIYTREVILLTENSDEDDEVDIIE